VRRGMNPGKRYASRSSRSGGRRKVIHELHAVPTGLQPAIPPMKPAATLAKKQPKFTHTKAGRPTKKGESCRWN
jgi:hypothetical protein